MMKSLFVHLVFIFIFFVPFRYEPVERALNCYWIDHDTLSCEKENIRLLYIDSPERDQKVRRSLARLDYTPKEYSLKIKGRDRYQRLLAEVYLNKIYLNLELVKNGSAIIYPFARFVSLKMKSQFLSALYSAQINKRGLWGQESSYNPYYWRKKKKELNKKLTLRGEM